jgi:hypothetical protein
VSVPTSHKLESLTSLEQEPGIVTPSTSSNWPCLATTEAWLQSGTL